MRFMTVDALELDGLSVDQHRAVIGDFHGTEADIDGPGVLPVQGIGHLVQVGRFRRPRLHAGKLPVQSHLNLASGGMAGTSSVPESSLPLLSVCTRPEPLAPSQFKLVEIPSME